MSEENKSTAPSVSPSTTSTWPYKHPLGIRPPPHTDKDKWERARSDSRPHRALMWKLFPTSWRWSFDAGWDRMTGTGWDSSGIIQTFQMPVPDKPGKCIFKRVLVRGDGKILSGNEDTGEELKQTERHYTCDSAAFGAHTATIEQGYLKGVTTDWYQYPGPPPATAAPAAAESKKSRS